MTSTIPDAREIPPGTLPHQCRKCQAIVYPVRTERNRYVDLDAVRKPDSLNPGEGSPHVESCAGWPMPPN